MKVFVIVVALLICPTWLWAQQGDRREPATSVFPTGYLDHAALSATLKHAAAEHPAAVRLSSLAKTAEGRDVWLATLGRPPAKGDLPRPAILIVANLEADHLVGSQVALQLIQRISSADGHDPDLTALLDRRTIYIVPRLNPDGAERLLTSPMLDLRTNLRPVDRDRDGKSGEDGPDDLDGDGVIVRMRVKDGKADMVPDSKDPRLLRKADPARGERALVSEYAEGTDQDHDGLFNEDPPGGVNLNRNWPHAWTEFDPEAGFSPASEPEVYGLIGFAFEHPEIAAVWSFSINDNLRTEPKKPATTLNDADLPLFADLVRLYAKSQGPGPKPTSSPGLAGMTDGALSEWAYHQFGVVGLASRLWAGPEFPATPPGQASPPADGEARWLFWNDHVMSGYAFVPFHPVNHPTLDLVEIGGWRPGVRLNPPIERVSSITEAQLSFLQGLAARLPALSIPEVKIEPKGGGLFAITAVVANDGYLPTALAQGVRTRKAPPVFVQLRVGEAKILTGKARNRINTLAGSGGRHEFHWLISAPETVRSIVLDVFTAKAGRVIKTLAL
ncbi:MAG: M14 family metallopeptidase [Isosphaeraceae bacterium]